MQEERAICSTTSKPSISLLVRRLFQENALRRSNYLENVYYRLSSVNMLIAECVARDSDARPFARGTDYPDIHLLGHADI